jgi:hypothetical protein
LRLPVIRIAQQALLSTDFVQEKSCAHLFTPDRNSIHWSYFGAFMCWTGLLQPAEMAKWKGVGPDDSEQTVR